MLHVLPVLFLILLLAYIMFKQRKNIEDMHENIEYLNNVAKNNTKKIEQLTTIANRLTNQQSKNMEFFDQILEILKRYENMCNK